MPPGSRRAIITPASAVTVSRSPPRQPSAAMVTRSATRPEASIRPNPYTTSGRPGGLANGMGRPELGWPGRRPGLEPGTTGGTGRAVMAASRAGGGCAAGSRGGRGDRPPGACSSGASFGEIAPVFVSEGELEHRNRAKSPRINARRSSTPGTVTPGHDRPAIRLTQDCGAAGQVLDRAIWDAAP